MKRRIWVLLLCAVMLFSIIPAALAEEEAETEKATKYLEINSKNFPDENLRACIIENCEVSGDENSGYYMTKAQMQAVKELDIYWLDIKSLAGIERFTELERLELGGLYEMQPYNFKQLKKLKEFHAEEIGLSSIDFSGMTTLVRAYIFSDKGENPAEMINFTNCTNLTNIETDAKVVNVKGCKKLETLYLINYSDRPFGTAQNLSDCTALKRFACYVDGTIDLSKLKELTVLLLGGSISSLDLSKNTKLEALSLGGNMSFSGYSGETDRAIDEEQEDEAVVSEAQKAADERVKEEAQKGAKYNYEAEYAEKTLKSLDVSKNTALEYLYLNCLSLSSVDVSKNLRLNSLNMRCPRFTAIDVSKNGELVRLTVHCALTSLDVTKNTKLTHLYCGENPIGALDLSNNPELSTLYCNRCEMTALDVSHNPKLSYIYAAYNHLTSIDLSSCPECQVSGYGQTVLADRKMEQNGDAYTFALKTFIGADPFRTEENWEGVWEEVYTTETDSSSDAMIRDGIEYDRATGVVTADHSLNNLHYVFDSGKGTLSVGIFFPLDDDVKVELVGYDYNYYYGIVTSDEYDVVEFKDATPYLVFTEDRAYEPRYRVITADGVIVDPAYYNVSFQNNDKPGTATLNVTMKQSGKSASTWFKLYLPPTEKTSIANVKNGIKVDWSAVPNAKGYVIYRRAWNLTSSGWTVFTRWNNTTATSWTDTKVYAGTRYQYGIKAYFDDPMDNFNLGMVGPLKTTVRITSRTLNAVTAGKKSMTVKWDGSKYFTGYQIKYATDKNFTKDVVAVKVTDPAAYSTVIKNLTSGKTYYVTVRSYHVFEGMTYFGEWSNVLSCKVK